MGRTGNMNIEDVIRRMCVPIENNVYSGDGDGVKSYFDNGTRLCVPGMHQLNFTYLIYF